MYTFFLFSEFLNDLSWRHEFYRMNRTSREHLPITYVKLLTVSTIKGSPCRAPALWTHHNLKKKKKRNNHIWSLDTQRKKSTLLIFQSPRAYKTPCKLAQTTKVNEKKSTFSSTPAGRMMGRNERECGQTGVTKIAATLGWTIEAPAATAYAVLPVGVEMIRPGMHTRSKRHITL